MKKFKTDKGKIYFFKKYYIVHSVNSIQAVNKDGYNSKNMAMKLCPRTSKVCTPEELIKIEGAWESLFECYDIEIMLFAL